MDLSFFPQIIILSKALTTIITSGLLQKSAVLGTAHILDKKKKTTACLKSLL